MQNNKVKELLFLKKKKQKNFWDMRDVASAGVPQSKSFLESWRPDGRAERGLKRAAHKRLKKRLLAFGFLACVSLFANVLANDKPLVMMYSGHLYFPVLQPIPEQTFGPAFLPTEADYTNPQVQASIRANGWMIWPLIPYGPDSIVWNASTAPGPPSLQNWLGTDDLSRDVLARVLYGLRTSLVFGFLLTLLASVIGITAGAIQGYYGGLLDLLGQRVIEIWSGLPQLFVLMILASILAPGFWLLLLFLLLFAWTALTNLVRAEFLRVRQLDFISAARVLGVPEWQIIWRHMLPNASVAVVTFLPFLLADSMTLLASLDYLGVGLPPGGASLGELVTQAQDNPHAPWLALAAFVPLGGMLFLLVLIGEAARERLAP